MLASDISRKVEKQKKEKAEGMHWQTVLALFLVSVGYLFIGAAVFHTLESGTELKTKPKNKLKISDVLANTSFILRNSSEIDQKQLETVILTILDAYDQGLLEANQTAPAEEWSFMSALCFSITVVSTVGYGKLAPSTPGGQLFCICYALLGIPFNAVLLIEVGRKLSAPIKTFRNKSKNKKVRMMKSALVCTTVTSLIIFLPSLIYHRTEGWTMLEAVYYTVITFTTIGFGDYIVDYHGRSKYSDVYQLLNSLLIFVGLSWAVATTSDINDLLTSRVKKDEHSLRRITRQKSNKDADADSRNGSTNDNQRY